MAGRLDGQAALVTGGSGGIGRATALEFAHQGARVVVSDVLAEAGQETVRLIGAAGGQATFIKTDVTQAAQVEALIGQTVETYGRLDCAFNNAGIEGGMAKTADYAEERWEQVIRINLKGVWLCMKYEIQHMLGHGGGAIVNTASVAGLVGFRYGPAYVASKHGVNGLTKTAALEYAKAGIRVNAVCPGVIKTPMFERGLQKNPDLEERFASVHPVGRIGQPEEIARAVVWLCSPAASFVTGTQLPVDGGFVAQ
ncbi:MAG: SDR family oxidoreductase [Desulfurellaceae bacterium]|nr:SDR family oxidoreductase [Desulfurellaceae bacterium]